MSLFPMDLRAFFRPTHVVHDEILEDDGSHGGGIDLPLFEPLSAVHGAADGSADFTGVVISLIHGDLVA